MTTLADRSLGDLAATYPTASRVFHRSGLDFCCGGARSLADACAEAGLDPARVAAAIEADSATDGDDLASWSTRAPDELIRHIVDHYHARLREELPELRALAVKVERRHAEHPSCPHGLAGHLEGMQDHVFQHLAKEEMILFPLIRSGRGAEAGGPIRCMESEHEDTGADLGKLRELTDGFTTPPDACPTWSALVLRLAALELEFMEHIHLENNVLFPAALAAEGGAR